MLPQCFGVLGDPVSHSRSPAMHGAAFRALGLDHRYLAFQVAADELHRAIDGARTMQFGGLNLTVPHKQRALSLVDEASEEAERIGAVNVICFAQGWSVGHNTDGRGFLDALAELEGDEPRRATVLGSGGAALAIVDALLHAYPTVELAWVSRNPAALPELGERVVPRDYEQVNEGEPPQLLVNATTVGMVGGPTEFPGPIELDRLRPGARVVDAVYPRPAGGLLERAESRGVGVQDGLAMLLWQGVRSLELWLGHPLEDVVVAALRAAIRAH